MANAIHPILTNRPIDGCNLAFRCEGATERRKHNSYIFSHQHQHNNNIRNNDNGQFSILLTTKYLSTFAGSSSLTRSRRSLYISRCENGSQKNEKGESFGGFSLELEFTSHNSRFIHEARDRKGG